MLTARAVAADEAWVPALASPAAGTVESSFDRALNVWVEGELLTVLARGGRRAPGALLSDAGSLPRLPAGTPVACGPDAVRAPGLTIEMAGPQWFDCRVRPLGACGRVDVEAISRLEDSVAAATVSGSFRPAPSAGPFERALAARLAAGATDFAAALAAMREGVDGAPGRLCTAVGGLIGLGAGLTPSGDDYVTGALLVLTLRGEADALGVLGPAVADLLGQTTPVGAQFLRAALQGRFHEDLTAAAHAALTSSADLPSAVRRVATIGSTSGSDALRGLADAVRVCCTPSTSSVPTTI